jgi:hypothetical protein
MNDPDAVPRWCDGCGTYHHGPTQPDDAIEPEDFESENEEGPPDHHSTTSLTQQVGK